VSKHQIDDGFTISDNLEVPEKSIHPAEIRLIQAHLGELMQHVIREIEMEE
jgi:hypothetical protein